MTGRHHQDSSPRTPRQLGRGSRPLVLAGALVAIVVVAAGFAFVLGGGLGNTAAPTAGPSPSPAATPVFSDLPLQTVPPTSFGPGSPSPATTSPEPSASASPGAEVGIPAIRIKIARLGINLAIIEGDGLDAPIGKAAHFPGSAWPGGGSNIYIYGHARTGMFLSLWQAKVGDQVELDLVDGSTRMYVVTQVLPQVAWDAVQYVDPTPTEQLTLQTSTSYYPTAPRFVVIAVPKT